MVQIDADAAVALEAVVQPLAGQLTSIDEKARIECCVRGLAHFAEQIVLLLEGRQEKIVGFDELVAVVCACQ